MSVRRQSATSSGAVEVFGVSRSVSFTSVETFEGSKGERTLLSVRKGGHKSTVCRNNNHHKLNLVCRNFTHFLINPRGWGPTLFLPVTSGQVGQGDGVGRMTE